MPLLLRLQTFMREINDENAKGITDAASGLAQSLADLKLRLRSEADRGKIEPIRTTVLPDFTAQIGELITMLNETNEGGRRDRKIVDEGQSVYVLLGLGCLPYTKKQKKQSKH